MVSAVHTVLRRCGFFRGLSEATLAEVAALGRMVRFDRGAVVFREGDPCPGLYAVGAGAVRVFRTAPGGKEHLLHLSEEGMTFAEVAAIGRFPCPATAQAVEDTVCALLPRDPFLRRLEEDHALCLQLLRGMAGWVHHLVGLMEDIVLRDAAGRLAGHLLRHTGRDDAVALPMLKKDLASHLNLTSETLSRTLRRLQDRALVEALPDGALRVLDRAALQRIADGSPLT
jgi:CRP/FNR family transcriptional regulator